MVTHTTMVGRCPLVDRITTGSQNSNYMAHNLRWLRITLLRGMSLVRRAFKSVFAIVCSVAVCRVTEDFGVDCRVTLRVRGSARHQHHYHCYMPANLFSFLDEVSLIRQRGPPFSSCSHWLRYNGTILYSCLAYQGGEGLASPDRLHL